MDLLWTLIWWIILIHEVKSIDKNNLMRKESSVATKVLQVEATRNETDQFSARSTVWRPVRLNTIKLNAPTGAVVSSSNWTGPVTASPQRDTFERHRNATKSNYSVPVTRNATFSSGGRFLAGSTTVRASPNDHHRLNKLNVTLGEVASELNERLMDPTDFSRNQLLSWFNQLNDQPRSLPVTSFPLHSHHYYHQKAKSAYGDSLQTTIPSYVNEPTQSLGYIEPSSEKALPFFPTSWREEVSPAVHYATTAQSALFDALQPTPSATFDSAEVQQDTPDASALFEQQIEQQIEQLRRLQNHFRKHREQNHKSFDAQFVNDVTAVNGDFWPSTPNQTMKPTVTYVQSFDSPPTEREIITNNPLSNEIGRVTFDDEIPHSLGQTPYESELHFQTPPQIKFTSNEAIANRSKSATINRFTSLLNSIEFPESITRSPQLPSVTYSQPLDSVDESSMFDDSVVDGPMFGASFPSTKYPPGSYQDSTTATTSTTNSRTNTPSAIDSPVNTRFLLMKAAQLGLLKGEEADVASGGRVHFRSKIPSPKIETFEFKRSKYHPDQLKLHLIRPHVPSPIAPAQSASGTIGGSESMRDLLRAMDAVRSAVDGVKPIRNVAGKTFNDLAERMRDRVRTWASTQYAAAFPHGFESEFDHSLRAERYGPAAGVHRPRLHPVSSQLLLRHPIQALPSYQYAAESMSDAQHSSLPPLKSIQLPQNSLKRQNQTPLSLLKLKSPLLTSSSSNQAAVTVVRNENATQTSNRLTNGSIIVKIPILNLRYSTLPTVLSSTRPTFTVHVNRPSDTASKPNADQPIKLMRYNMTTVSDREQSELALKLLHLLNGNLTSKATNQTTTKLAASPVLFTHANTILYRPQPIAIKGQISWPNQGGPLIVRYNALDQAQMVKNMYSLMKMPINETVTANQSVTTEEPDKVVNSGKSAVSPLFEPIRTRLSRLFRQLERQLAGRRMADDRLSRKANQTNSSMNKVASGSNSREEDIETNKDESNELNDYDRRWIEQVMRDNHEIEDEDEEDHESDEASDDVQDSKTNESRRKRDGEEKLFSKRRMARKMTANGLTEDDPAVHPIQEKMWNTMDPSFWLQLRALQASMSNLNLEFDANGKRIVKNPEVIYAENSQPDELVKEGGSERLPSPAAQVIRFESPSIEADQVPIVRNHTSFDPNSQKLREKTQIELFERGMTTTSTIMLKLN